MARKTTTKRRNPSTLGSVQQLPSGRFRAFYRVEGDTFNAPQTFDTRDAANGWLATERADRLRGTWRDPRQGQELLSDYVTGWLGSRADLAPRTRDLYDSLATNWITRPVGNRGKTIDLGALALAQITPSVVRRWIELLNEATKAAALARIDGHPSRARHPARVWARANGRAVPDTGRLSPAILRAWQAAGSPRPALTRAQAADPGRSAAVNAYRLLRTILNAAVRDGLIATNPCQIKGAATVRANERSIATPEEVAAIAAAMPAHLSAAVYVAAWSALRFGELFALTRRNVDLTAGTLRVQQSLNRSGSATPFGLTKTRGSVRTVYLPRPVVELLAAHMRQHTPLGPDALIFSAKSGRPIANSNLSASFSRARATIGREDLTWHGLRHTGATLAYRAGATVRDVQRRLGHTTTRAAMIYAHISDESDRLIAERLAETYGDTMATVVPLRPTGTNRV